MTLSKEDAEKLEALRQTMIRAQLDADSPTERRFKALNVLRQMADDARDRYAGALFAVAPELIAACRRREELETELAAIKRLAAEVVHADQACGLVYTINTAYDTPGAHWKHSGKEEIRRARAVLEKKP